MKPKPAKDLPAWHGERMRMLRELRGLSQLELAFRTGQDPIRISKHERNVFEPRLWLAAVYARELGTTLDFLVGLTDKP